MFVDQWRTDISTRSKLQFYNSIKPDFGEELYLSLNNKAIRDSIARIRSSSHDLNIERGRHIAGNIKQASKTKMCRFCCLSDTTIAEYHADAENLPFFSPTIESEVHALIECPGYHHLRSKLSDDVKSLLMLRDLTSIMYDINYIMDFGIYHICSQML